jgi:hypothetical protein
LTDNHLIELAIAGGAQAIVSKNLVRTQKFSGKG